MNKQDKIQETDKGISPGRRPETSRNSYPQQGGTGSELTATRRPSHLKGMRKQEQLTFNFEARSPVASLRLPEGRESGRTNVPTGNYWSSTTNANNTTNALNVNFNNGSVDNNNKTNNNYVVAVRGGKCQGRLPREMPISVSERPAFLESGKKDIFSFENIYSAYLQCRKRKRGTINALKFELKQEDLLLSLQERLINRTYQPGRSILFAAVKPKLREIFAADFEDRIVHHILVRELEKIWEPRFIYDSYVCRRNKGVHRAAMRLQKFIRQVSSNGTRKAYYIKLDIRNFFNTLDKDILFAIISRKVKNDEMLWLTKVILYHDCTKNFVSKDRAGLLARVPAHKSLFTESPERGLPIGNLTSQFFANVYLNRLDQYVKRELKCRYYIRYADDFVLLGRDRVELKEWM
ncbi:MAG: reverse transcriptase domain-containing protein, partial [Candidatus Omnitrophota bacterium]